MNKDNIHCLQVSDVSELAFNVINIGPKITDTAKDNILSKYEIAAPITDAINAPANTNWPIYVATSRSTPKDTPAKVSVEIEGLTFDRTVQNHWPKQPNNPLKPNTLDPNINFESNKVIVHLIMICNAFDELSPVNADV